MAHPPRGITPELLLSQVKNTMPYLFEPSLGESSLSSFVPAQVLRDYERTTPELLSHFEYFRLCLSSHYLTCATPVPTDVDNQIRHKLWPAGLALESALQMAQLVLESHHWDFTAVTARFSCGAVGSPFEKEPLSGHLGEWFTVSAAAYCALRPYSSASAHEMRQKLLDQIASEVERHSEIFGSLWKAQDGLGCLKSSASIAHNFGDLDRVLDMWDLPIEDPLRLGFYKLATHPFDPNGKLRYLGRLWVAGELYKSTIAGSSMALENHRHFALRKPRCLRQSPKYWITTGPFLDEWGRQVALSEDPLEVAQALKSGWERLPKTLGYGRALCGMREVLPKLDLGNSLRETSQERFEKNWSEEALRLIDEIPSRA